MSQHHHTTTPQQGLSLDYIHELTTKNTASSTASNATTCTPEEALEQHKNEIKLDIVARFNAAQRAGNFVLWVVHSNVAYCVVVSSRRYLQIMRGISVPLYFCYFAE